MNMGHTFIPVPGVDEYKHCVYHFTEEVRLMLNRLK